MAYGVTLYCPIPIRLGDTWWAFDDPSHWPPAKPRWPWDSVSSPYQVPGIVVLSSTSKAVFRADVDGSELQLTRGAQPTTGEACL